MIEKACKIAVRLLKLLAVFVLLLTPIVAIGSSFNPTSFVLFPPQGFSLRWYESFFSDPGLMAGLKNSLLLAVPAVVTSLTLATSVAFVIARYKFKGKSTLDTLIFSPMVFPEVCFGTALLVFFFRLNFTNSFAMLLIAHTILALPYVFRVVLPCFYGISRSFEEAALTLGANKIQTFLRITLPLIKPGLFAGVLLGFAASFNNFAVSVFLVSVYTQTLPVRLMGLMRAGIDPTIGAASAMVCISMIILLIIVEKLVGIERLVGGMYWR